MSQDERERWDARYAEGTYVARAEPSPFLLEWLPRIRVGRALDVATGTGRHAFALAQAGFTVDAVDISRVAVDRARQEAVARGQGAITWHVADLDEDALPGSGYDLITVVRYRNAALWPRLRASLAPDGWIVVEHHLQTAADVGGPTSDDFRLAPGELLEAFRGARIVHYSEGLEPADVGAQDHFAIARLVACVGDPGW